jgi:sugar lactone lactonase YvrE
MQKIELLLDAHSMLGESPTWFAADGLLFWIDVRGRSLHRLSLNGSRRVWQLSADIGAFALLEGAIGAVVALRSGVFQLDFRSGDTALLAQPPFDPALFRFNEGICDAQGRFWIGVMFDVLPAATGTPISRGPMQRFTLGEGLIAGEDQSDLHNGFAWSGSGDAFFWAHSSAHRVYRAPYDLTRGIIGRAEPYLEVGSYQHVPDGAAMDEEGCYWCAVHGAGVLRRYDSGGRLLGEVPLPVSQPTMCAFVGADLDTMVVTSARENLTPEQLAREPWAGGIFSLRPGVRGVPRPCVVH